MVTIQPETTSKDKTVKQVVLINNLLQSRYFSKAEFQKYKKLELKTIRNSYEAGLLIALLIAKLRFKKKFSSKRSRARLICSVCKSKKELIRMFNPSGNRQHVLCFKCEEKMSNASNELDKLPGKVKEAERDVQSAIDEKKEASADLHSERLQLEKTQEESEELEQEWLSSQDMEEKVNPVDEKQEASADLYRKYEYEEQLCTKCKEKLAVQSGLCGSCLDEIHHA